MTLVQGRSDSTFANLLSLEMAKPIEAKFHVEPPWDGGTKVYSVWPPCPYMVKTLKKSSLELKSR